MSELDEWVLCARARMNPAGSGDLLRLRSLFGRGQLEDLFAVQTKQVEDISQTFAVQTGRRFELDSRLGAPCDTETGGVQHEEIVGAISNGKSL